MDKHQTLSAPQKLAQDQREEKYQQKGTIIWLSGLSGAGKTTVSVALERALFGRNVLTALLDGDVVRNGLNVDLGFSAEDRKENIRRIGEVAKLLAHQALVVIVAFISPFQRDRNRIRHSMEAGRFVEVFVDCPLEVCEHRDTKGLYQKARNGLIQDFTGISSPYEPPVSPEIHLKTAEQSVEDCVEEIIRFLERAEIIKVVI
ncbi:MAG: adenylyl-sulfate kinase [Nitrospinaceae bacterium]|nr:adenylyl-sulfate kinase [Nitrospinaceae bacterium]NIR53916.1 adenylyl-sulfate kinase [Nitrospinaceae bacterium]NIS84333.1 adenylyl-sulfate kinase [Nitrospinaceae bacterium]NIT81137.1 adenylyl-sulfate kinase [Nitrospinaceae bacterium]NIU43419.1 adenylyl-sulfate kinase [Nitrospinaceae bacterium]